MPSPLVEINPAFMTRQVSELAMDTDGVQFHITSLNPIRPQNTPTSWAQMALKSFEQGVKDADEAEGLSLGAVDYIIKPVRPLIVKARVNNHLELKRQRDFLKELTMRDGLTGIFNRRYFDEYYDREWRRACRSGEHIAMIMVDIDHFKAYNDNYGHSMKDDCLRQVAQALKGEINRAADLVARYGGEEFVCVLPGMSEEGRNRLVFD